MNAQKELVPNHHANYPGFAGLTGVIAALTMVVDRERDAQLAAQLSGLGPEDMLVDVGCGPGTAARQAARLGASVVGVDPAAVMIRVAGLLTRPSAGVRYELGSAECLPLTDGSASVLWTIASVHHWSDLDVGLTEARRVLKPGGRLVAIERRTVPGAHGHASHGWTEDQASAFASLCEKHGFVGAQVGRHEGNRRATLTVTAQIP